MNDIHYQSTRGKSEPATPAETIIRGLAPDGGLYVPAGEVTAFAPDNLPSGRYQELARKILSLYLSDYSNNEVEDSVMMAYNTDKFDHPKITPLHKLTDQLFILELWHGPTYAFKDIALQILPYLMQFAVKKTAEKLEIVILTATSGDTGKSALEGFRDVAGTKIITYFPQDGVSTVQRLQMTTQQGANVCVAAVQGNFDDAQSGVKKVFSDPGLAQRLASCGYRLSSANSINWGRLLPQITYYFSAYNELVDREVLQAGDQVNFIVPTGNFGNILAGYYACQLGLPVKRLICASNRNNVLSDFIKSGVYNSKRQLYQTTSPSMDILISSNLERLLYALNGRDPELISSWMASLSDSGQFSINRQTFEKLVEIFWSDYADDDQTGTTIADIYHNHNYLIDPHTAVGKAVYDQYLHLEKDNSPAIILSTASPFKFTGSVMKALQKDHYPGKISELDLLETLADMTGLNVPANLAILKESQVRHEDLISPDKISDHLVSFLGLNRA